VTREYFEFFGLQRNLALDTTDLVKRFYALSRKYHPDLYARKSRADQDEALEASAVLNDAYRTLRDPITRLTYLLKLEGFDIGEQGTKDVPPELLEEIFELNMALEENPADSAGRERFVEMRNEIDAEMQGKFSDWDAGHNRETLVHLRGLLNRRKYISNLIDKTNVPD
jgi:molecular chaperone HscB